MWQNMAKPIGNHPQWDDGNSMIKKYPVFVGEWDGL